jgi:hypothetical protein
MRAVTVAALDGCTTNRVDSATIFTGVVRRVVRVPKHALCVAVERFVGWPLGSRFRWPADGGIVYRST